MEEEITTINKREKLHRIPRTPQITGDGSMHLPPTTPSREVVAMQNSLGDGSMHSSSTSPSREVVAMQNSLVNRLLQSIEKLQTEVMEVNKKVDAFLRKFTGGDFPTIFPEPLPLGIRLPINCDEDLIDLNNKLLDTGFQTTL
ncbi:hypothetical protein AVEN_54287-1, partial [Araneus ventricosus]